MKWDEFCAAMHGREGHPTWFLAMMARALVETLPADQAAAFLYRLEQLTRPKELP